MTFGPDTTSTIRLCERCYAPIEPGERYYRLAHPLRARPDGSIDWVDSYVHTDACTTVTAGDGTACAPGDRCGCGTGRD